MSQIEVHNLFLEAAFSAVLEAEKELAEIKAKLDEATILLRQAKNGAEKRLNDAWAEVENILKESGEFEVSMPFDNVHHYKIGWNTPRQSVKIIDAEAVPDALCKIERNPKLKEIGDMLKDGMQTNYAKLEYGEKHLQYRVVKSTKELENVE